MISRLGASGQDLKVLEQLRESKAVITRETYKACCLSLQLNGVGDWEYRTIGRKLYMVLHTYSSLGVKIVLSESEDKFGFEGYRLLSREYDPVSTKISHALLERDLVITRWQGQTIEDECGALREALKRAREIERSCKDEPCQFRMRACMFYANVLSPSRESML